MSFKWFCGGLIIGTVSSVVVGLLLGVIVALTLGLPGILPVWASALTGLGALAFCTLSGVIVGMSGGLVFECLYEVYKTSNNHFSQF